MTKEEAKQILKYHSFTHEDVNHSKMGRGFLGMLSSFTGELIEENYQEVSNAIQVLTDEIRDNKKIDKEIISAVWGIK